MAELVSRKDDYGYIMWAAEVKRIGHFQCDICGRRGNLNSHHLYSWSDNPDKRFDISNGICLCKSCHDLFHEINGKGHNTPDQYKEFKKTQEIIIKTARASVSKEVAVKRMLEKAEKDILLQKILSDVETESERLQNDKEDVIDKLSSTKNEDEKIELSKQLEAIESLEHLTG